MVLSTRFSTWFVLLIFVLSFQLSAQWAQVGNKLVGSEPAGASSQGAAIAVSRDGNTMIVGGQQDNSGAGAAWIFARIGNSWQQQGTKLVGTGAEGNAYQGISVAVSANGSTAIVGGYGDGLLGAAWVFVRTGNSWVQQGNKLVGTGAAGYSSQGRSVALSDDGNTALVGGSNDSSDLGAVWVFTRTAGTWTQQGSKLVGSGAVGIANQGTSVALSADGNTALVGGWNDSSNVGAIWVFARAGDTWTQQGSKLVASGAVGKAYLGFSAALSADGNTALAGGFPENNYTGSAWIFTRSGSTWTQGSKLVGTNPSGFSYQGSSVALSSDGNTAIVGGYADSSYTGAAWVYALIGGQWTQIGNKIIGTGAGGKANQGRSVALSGDGNFAFVGGMGDNGGTGAVWVFTGPRPSIASVSDIPSDQGGKVFVLWTSSGCEAWPLQGVQSYTIYRGVKASQLPKAQSGKAIAKTTRNEATGELIFWEHAADVSPHWLSGYSYPVATASDSTAHGNPMYYFMVTANTTSPLIFYDSAPDSGYSVDNIPPIGVGNAFIASNGGGILLKWSKNRVDKDLMEYRIYRSTTTGFTVGSGTQLSTTTDTTYNDQSGTNGTPYYYRIAAVDVHGNIGSSSNELSETALSLELTSFVVTANRNNASILWSVATETNNFGFEIERKSMDTDRSNFQRVGFVEGNGTSQTARQYSYTDRNVESGIFAYRLKQIDQNGQYKYSQVIEVTMGVAPNVFELAQNYPNPFNPTTTIEFTVQSNGLATLKVFNAIGEQVATLFNREAEAGKYNQVEFNASNLASGIYFAKLQSGDKVQLKKMMMIK